MDPRSRPTPRPQDPPLTRRHGDPDHSMLDEEPLGWDQAPQETDDLPMTRHAPPADPSKDEQDRP